MSFRQLFLAKKYFLKYKQGSIIIEDEDKHINKIPIEDLTVIVIDSNEILLTNAVICACAAKNVSIIIAGDNHMPQALISSINQHYRPFQVIQYQIAQTDTIKALAAEYFLKAKINNQIKVIELTNKDENVIKLLSQYENELEGNDEMNREGTAAKVFFNSLYGSDYIRFEKDGINMLQNYGYGVLRSSITRTINSYGLSAFIGVNHKSATNPFNLVYDIIEPFRAIVDYYIYKNLYMAIDNEIPIEARKELVNLLNASVEVKGKKQSVQNAIDLLVKSYLRYIEFGEVDFDLPKVIEIDFNKLNEFV